MKIATWNLERPAGTGTRIRNIEKLLAALNADILVLTETNDCINPGPGYNCYHTSPLEGFPVTQVTNRNTVSITSLPSKTILYKKGERRCSIYSKYPASRELQTFNKKMAICVQFQTPLGELAVYATIIGVYGNREKSFTTDLELQLANFHTIAAQTNLCIAGDLNMSFADNYYYTKEGREKLNSAFEALKLVNMTAYLQENIDHIILPGNFIAKKRDMETWNTDKSMSDHTGVSITI